MAKKPVHTLSGSIGQRSLYLNDVCDGSSIGKQIENKEVVKIRARPAEGYQLAGRTDNGEIAGFSAEYEFRMPENHTVAAETLKTRFQTTYCRHSVKDIFD